MVTGSSGHMMIISLVVVAMYDRHISNSVVAGSMGDGCCNRQL